MADKAKQTKEAAPAEAPETFNVKEFMDRPMTGKVPITFGVTMGDSKRRAAYKAEGLSKEQIQEKMKEHKRKVKGSVDLTGMTFRKFVNAYALQKMAVEIRTGLYPLADAAPSLEEADGLLDDFIKGDLVWPWNDLAASPWNETGRKTADPMTKVNRALNNADDDTFAAMLKAVEAEKARREAAAKK